MSVIYLNSGLVECRKVLKTKYFLLYISYNMLQYCCFLEIIIRASDYTFGQVKVLSPLARMASQKNVKRRHTMCVCMFVYICVYACICISMYVCM